MEDNLDYSTDAWELINAPVTSENFIVSVIGDDCLELKIRTIEWNGVCTPVVIFVAGPTLALDASEEEINAAHTSILNNKRYFKTCAECSKLITAGYFNTDENYCMGCAQSNHGVVY